MGKETLNRVELIWNHLIQDDFDKVKFEALKNNHDVVIFGAGEDGKALFNVLHNQNISIKYFFDNDIKKKNTYFNKIEIKNPNEFLAIKKNFLFLIANSNHSFEIRKQLETSFPYSDIYTYQELFLQFIDGSILEIGPLNNPNFRGGNVNYFDVLNSEGLRKKTIQWGLNPIGVPDKIDYVSANGDLAVVDRTFSCVYSAHVIEHQPDFVEHLLKVEYLLEHDGVYIMVIPDKRYCMDHYKRLSTIEEVLTAYNEKRKKHTLKTMLDGLYSTHNNSEDHWKGKHGEQTELTLGGVENVMEAYDNSNGQYMDAHAWQFTPESFERIIVFLNQLGIIQLSFLKVYDTSYGQQEFYAVLKK